jgi:hypothetical protein
MIDAETIFIYKTIKKCNNDLQVMCELVNHANIEYLIAKTVLISDQTYKFAPLFASGKLKNQIIFS